MSVNSNLRIGAFPAFQTTEATGLEKGNKNNTDATPHKLLEGLEEAGRAFQRQRLAAPPATPPQATVDTAELEAELAAANSISARGYLFRVKDITTG